MQDPDDSAARAALLAELEAQRHAHPYLVTYFIAQAMHSARLGALATVDDLDNRGLRAVVEMGRMFACGGRLP